MTVRDLLQQQIVRLDGGMGTLLQAEGLQPGELPERWNVSHPDKITAIHKAYYEAGSQIVSANTFGANSLKFDDEKLDKMYGFMPCDKGVGFAVCNRLLKAAGGKIIEV